MNPTSALRNLRQIDLMAQPIEPPGPRVMDTSPFIVITKDRMLTNDCQCIVCGHTLARSAAYPLKNCPACKSGRAKPKASVTE